MDAINLISQKEAVERIAVLIKERNLIPVFGAGFSMNSKAEEGIVPSGDKATELMKNILLTEYEDLRVEEIKTYDFNINIARILLPLQVGDELRKNEKNTCSMTQSVV